MRCAPARAKSSSVAVTAVASFVASVVSVISFSIGGVPFPRMAPGSWGLTASSPQKGTSPFSLIHNFRRYLFLVVVTFLAATALYAHAHRSGCHHWHSCPWDTGSYVCGDTGYCSQCPDNQYCLAGQPRHTQSLPQEPKKSSEQARPGVPPRDAWTCPASQPIKGNFTTYSGERCIYHVPGGQFYDKTKPERCYAPGEEPPQDGRRRSKR